MDFKEIEDILKPFGFEITAKIGQWNTLNERATFVSKERFVIYTNAPKLTIVVSRMEHRYNISIHSAGSGETNNNACNHALRWFKSTECIASKIMAETVEWLNTESKYYLELPYPLTWACPVPMKHSVRTCDFDQYLTMCDWLFETVGPRYYNWAPSKVTVQTQWGGGMAARPIRIRIRLKKDFIIAKLRWT